MESYWGTNGSGYVCGERWLLPRASLVRLARRYELAIFTGRTRQELTHTLRRFAMRKYFRRIITFNDVRRTKPDPEGLLRILGDRHRQSALYLGDNVDDAIAARRAGIPGGSGRTRLLPPRSSHAAPRLR